MRSHHFKPSLFYYFRPTASFYLFFAICSYHFNSILDCTLFLPPVFGSSFAGLILMASTSRPSSSAPRRRYDVFMSFRGEETRRGFISHLYHELQDRKGIQTFMDEKGLETGTRIASGLQTAIAESRSAIVVLSPDYASSRWCLDELTMICQCMEDKKTIVFPVFYDVDPSDVRHQKTSFAEAFTRHEECRPEDVKQWRAALTKVADLSGLELKKYRSDQEFVKAIAETVCSKLRPIEIEWPMFTGDFVAFDVTKQAMDKVMRALKDDEVTAIGVFGMGGVGKTSMVKHVGAHARKIGLFDRVIMAVVSQTPNLRNIQGTLADLLGFKLEEETETGRAARLMEKIIRGNRILIVLDDVWERIDLSSIGIPNLTELQRCNSKILFTTRTSIVCNAMESQESIPLQDLSEEDAWNLFAKKARKSFEEGTEFYDVARMVARECAGLPIALIAVARVLGDKDLEDWKEAAGRLKAAQPANYEDNGDVLKCIKLSYDYLRSDESRSFFLLCCLFPEDYDIPVEVLFKYAIGKGLFQDACTIIEARGRAHSVANYIKASSLLLDSEYKGCVRMHDVIRDVAISISLLEDDSRFLVKAGCGLRDWPRIKAHEGYSAISLMGNEIHKLPKEPVCPELLILLLQCNLIDEIPNTFFPSPNKLRVLDLSGTSVSSLPSSVSLLTNLQALYLDDCKRIVDISIIGNLKNLQILSMKNLNKRGNRRKEMPKEIGRLASLKMLDVTDACFQTVPSNVISNLKGLEELYMTCDFCDWGRSSSLELGVLLSFAVGKKASFDELTGLSRLNSLKVRMCDVKCLPQTVSKDPNWVNFNICISDKDFMSRSYYGRFLERKLTDKMDPRFFRYVTLNTSISFIPYWFINVVMEKAEMLEYIGYNSLSNILEEYDRGRLYSLKYLAIIDCCVQGGLMILGIRNEAVFGSLEELYLEGVYELEELCVGELPRGSLCKLKLLNVRNCQKLHGVLLPPKLLQRLQNLESLHCECTEDASATMMLEYVFAYEGLKPEQMVLTKLREITLCYVVNLISIWNGPAPYHVFRNLKSLALRGCHTLKNLFPSSVAKCLGQLELLWVEECSVLETVIESCETEINVVVIPQLKDIYLSNLLQLTGIYSDTRLFPNHKVFCPSLEHFYVYKCPKLSNLAVSDFCSRNQVQTNDHGHFAIIFERLFHRQFNPEEIPQFFSKKSSDDFSVGSVTSTMAYGQNKNWLTQHKSGFATADKEGEEFDDGIYSTVRQLVLHYNKHSVDCIQIEYDRNGISHWSDKHGDPNVVGETTTVMLDYPDEFITSVHGSYGTVSGRQSHKIFSLTFWSNRRTYGPFGCHQFGGKLETRTFSMHGSKIVGFHGTSSRVNGLLAIGAHLRESPTLGAKSYFESKGSSNLRNPFRKVHGSSSSVDRLLLRPERTIRTHEVAEEKEAIGAHLRESPILGAKSYFESKGSSNPRNFGPNTRNTLELAPKLGIIPSPDPFPVRPQIEEVGHDTHMEVTPGKAEQHAQGERKRKAMAVCTRACASHPPKH